MAKLFGRVRSIDLISANNILEVEQLNFYSLPGKALQLQSISGMKYGRSFTKPYKPSNYSCMN